MKILIIEDDMTLAGFYKDWLGRFDHDVIVTSDIDKAIEMIDEATELITLDVNLSEVMRGAKTISKIPQIKMRAPNALLIVMTGALAQEDAQQCLDAGADGFITKSEIFSEPSFFKKFGDIVKSLLTSGPPPKNEQHLRVMEKIAQKTAEYFRRQTQQLKPS